MLAVRENWITAPSGKQQPNYGSSLVILIISYIALVHLVYIKKEKETKD